MSLAKSNLKRVEEKAKQQKKASNSTFSTHSTRSIPYHAMPNRITSDNIKSCTISQSYIISYHIIQFGLESQTQTNGDKLTRSVSVSCGKKQVTDQAIEKCPPPSPLPPPCAGNPVRPYLQQHRCHPTIAAFVTGLENKRFFRRCSHRQTHPTLVCARNE